MKFKLAVKKNNKFLIKMVLDDGQEKWATTSQAVFNFAKNNFKEGDDADFVYRVDNNQYFVDRINKPGYKQETQSGGYNPNPSSQDSGQKPAPSSPQKTYSPYNSGDYMKPRTPEEAERMTRLSILSSVCEAIKVFSGTINDANTLWEMVETIYNDAYKKITE